MMKWQRSEGKRWTRVSGGRNSRVIDGEEGPDQGMSGRVCEREIVAQEDGMMAVRSECRRRPLKMEK